MIRGSTNDFSLIRVGPTIRRKGRKPSDLLGNAGVGAVGDNFDAKVVASALGSESQNHWVKSLPLSHGLRKAEALASSSFLKARDVMKMLRGLAAESMEPEKIKVLIHLIREDLGFQLHRSVQKMKCDLSRNTESTFEFSGGNISLEAKVERKAFEEWMPKICRRLKVAWILSLIHWVFSSAK